MVVRGLRFSDDWRSIVGRFSRELATKAIRIAHDRTGRLWELSNYILHWAMGVRY